MVDILRSLLYGAKPYTEKMWEMRKAEEERKQKLADILAGQERMGTLAREAGMEMEKITPTGISYARPEEEKVEKIKPLEYKDIASMKEKGWKFRKEPVAGETGWTQYETVVGPRHAKHYPKPAKAKAPKEFTEAKAKQRVTAFYNVQIAGDPMATFIDEAIRGGYSYLDIYGELKKRGRLR